MKLEELKYFFAVCEYKSFNLAARNLYISRQSIIRNITNLENELNMPLFSRGYTGVELTDFGKAFYERSKEAVRLLEELEHFTETYNQRNNQKITIGIRGKFRSAYTMKKLIERFIKENPEIQIEIIDGSGVDICNYVESERIDMGFTLFEPDMSESLVKIPIVKFNQVFLLNKKHVLAKEQSIKPDMLDGERIIITAYSSIPSALLKSFIGDSSKPEEILATVDHHMVFNLLETNEYITMMLENDAKRGIRDKDDIICLPMDPPLTLDMGLIYNKKQKLSLQQKLFIEYVKNNFNKYYK